MPERRAQRSAPVATWFFRDSLVAARPTSAPAMFVVAVFALLGAVLYAVHPPAVPDLAAQVARADAARSGAFLGWNGWFGGLQLPAYSALSPIVMAGIGVGAAAALAALGATLGGFDLLRHSRRPLSAVVVLSLFAFADVLAGRVSFALGGAAAIGCLGLMMRRRVVIATGLALLTFLLSPLAGLFLGLGAVAVALAQPERRRVACVVAGALGAAAIVQTVAFPGAGEMPYPWWHMLLAVVTITGVAAVCPNRTVRMACALVGLATLAFWFVPSPVGTNIVRLTWLAAGPTVVAASNLRRWLLVLMLAAVSVWPAIDLGIQLDKAGSPASQASFFTPLVAAWRQQADLTGMQAQGERVELVDPASQWGAAYVAPIVPIARGWDRPTDRADNPLFYNGTLTSASYRAWLLSSSVGWVALPNNVALDYASVGEAAIVNQHPSYLKPVWQDASWQLFRVVGAEPIISGATLVQASEKGVTFHAAAGASVEAKIRWSPYLRLISNGKIVDACLTEHAPWTQIGVQKAGTYTLAARIDPGSDAHTGTCSTS